MKLLVPERGRAAAAAAWLAADRRVSSLLLYPEARAALARARRMRRVTAPEFEVVRRRMETLWISVDEIAVTEPLVRRAGALAEEHGLRGYDSVHFASFERAAGPDTVLVSAGAELLAAARSAGFAIAPV